MKEISIVFIKNTPDGPYISIGVNEYDAERIRDCIVEFARYSLDRDRWEDTQKYITAVNDLEKAINELQRSEKLQEDK